MMEAVFKPEMVKERLAAGRKFEMSTSGSERASMVRVTGPLDIQHSSEFLEELRPLCDEPRLLVVDLRSADYVDSSGVRALMQLEERLSASRGELRLVIQPESRVARVLTLLRLMERLRVYAPPAEAWATHGFAAAPA